MAGCQHSWLAIYSSGSRLFWETAKIVIIFDYFISCLELNVDLYSILFCPQKFCAHEFLVFSFSVSVMSNHSILVEHRVMISRNTKLSFRKDLKVCTNVHYEVVYCTLRNTAVSRFYHKIYGFIIWLFFF